jgi:hypothetical protein
MQARSHTNVEATKKGSQDAGRLCRANGRDAQRVQISARVYNLKSTIVKPMVNGSDSII